MRLSMEEHPFEQLIVDAEVAEDIFFDSPHKLDQIPQIASQLSDGELYFCLWGHVSWLIRKIVEFLDNKISLYRIGHHVDISRGPMVGNTGFVGRATVTAAHKLNSSIKNLYRFQGVALPKGFTVIIKNKFEWWWVALSGYYNKGIIDLSYFIFPDKPFRLWNSWAQSSKLGKSF
jgi:threonyl-tRNA synthetase